MTVEQLMRRSQSTAAGAIPSGNHVKEAARIETIRCRIEPEQHRAAHQCGNGTGPEENRTSAPDFRYPRRRQAGRRQWNADLTSGLHSTIKTQMPMGSPTMQQHPTVQGIMPSIVAVITKP